MNYGQKFIYLDENKICFTKITNNCEWRIDQVLRNTEKNEARIPSPLLFFLALEVCKLRALINHLVLILETPLGEIDVSMEKLRGFGCTDWILKQGRNKDTDKRYEDGRPSSRKRRDH